MRCQSQNRVRLNAGAVPSVPTSVSSVPPSAAASYTDASSGNHRSQIILRFREQPLKFKISHHNDFD